MVSLNNWAKGAGTHKGSLADGIFLSFSGHQQFLHPLNHIRVDSHSIWFPVMSLSESVVVEDLGLLKNRALTRLSRAYGLSYDSAQHKTQRDNTYPTTAILSSASLIAVSSFASKSWLEYRNQWAPTSKCESWVAWFSDHSPSSVEEQPPITGKNHKIDSGRWLDNCHFPKFLSPLWCSPVLYQTPRTQRTWSSHVWRCWMTREQRTSIG